MREIADSLADLFLGTDAAHKTDPTRSRDRTAQPEQDAMAVGDASTGVRPGGTSPRVTGGSARTSWISERVNRTRVLHIEMLVLGHLPVLAGAWVTQYAAQAARALGKPVALIRLDPDALTVDLVGLAAGVGVARVDTLSQALDTAEAIAGAWILRVDELAEATVADTPGIDAITLLSGVSESSIVAAYRALKSIVQRAGARGTPMKGQTSPELRIALLGATVERANEASSRIRKAAATFLGRPVGLVVCDQRIGPATMSALYRGTCDRTASELLGRLRGESAAVEHVLGAQSLEARGHPAHDAHKTDTLSAPDSDQAATGATTVVTPRAPQPVEPIAGDPDVDWLLEPAAVGPDQRADAAPAGRGGATERQQSPSPERIPVVVPQRQATTGQAAASVVASPLAPLLGLISVPVRCPAAPIVDLALDGAGGVHMICADEISAPEPGRGGVAALLAAEAWATANADLITRALPGSNLSRIILHLFTRQPASARDLLGTRVKVHLLARATGPGDVCVGLN